jgi:DNA gyrase/topoisomerase IV subunit A
MDAKQLEKAEEKGLVEFFKLTSKINTTNMMCFDFDSKIKKYNSPEEIIEDFYPMRLAYYQKRKVWRVFFFSDATDTTTFRRTTRPMRCRPCSRG